MSSGEEIRSGRPPSLPPPHHYATGHFDSLVANLAILHGTFITTAQLTISIGYSNRFIVIFMILRLKLISLHNVQS